MLCFVYCEWIDDDRLRAALPAARKIGTGRLDDYRLVFRRFHEDDGHETHGGGCHLEASIGSITYGVLYEFSDEEVAIAESLSRVQQGRYVPTKYTVIDESGRGVIAEAYIIKHPMGPSEPTDEYRRHLFNGAHMHGFPIDYLRWVNRSVADG